MFANRLKLLRISLGLNQKDFGKLLNYSKQAISYFEKGQREIPEQLISILKTRYGENFGLTAKEQESKPYTQPSEGPHLVSSADAGSYGQPDLSQHQVTQVFEPEIEMYLNMARQILTSGQPGAINALKSNLIAFHEQVQDKARLKDLSDDIVQLHKEIRTLKTITGGCAETSAAREAGNE